MPRTATRAKRAQAKTEPAETHLLKDQQVSEQSLQVWLKQHEQQAVS